MARIRKHSRLLQEITLTFLAICVVASPFSAFGTNVAHAQAVPAAAGTSGAADTTNPCGPGKTLTWDPATALTSPSSIIPSQVISNGYVCKDNASGEITPRPASSTSCGSVLAFMASPFTCMFRTLVSLTAATLIYISSWILTVAGLLFNWLVVHTIVQFGDLFNVVQGAVTQAWTAFRDIANIIIIGMFTFIALSIILGLKEFGQKKLIARVLIIAVLINFSLLFTKMIIDASNFTATQLYNAAGLQTPDANQNIAAANATPSSTDYAQLGIAGQFINLLGVGTWGNAYTAVNNIAEAKDSGWVALLHGLFVMAILLGAAVVLLYGSFLLVSRVVLLIILMVTASLAFASYLIPRWEKAHYGWSTWWSSLFQSAVFAPLLMFFLWTTLTVSYGLVKFNPSGAPTRGTFGDMIANPTSAPDINTLFIYVMILGLLFASFRLSSSFAKRIAGFDWAAMVPGIGLGIAGLAGGMLARNTVGWAASKGLSAMRGRDLAYQTQDGRWVGGAVSGPMSRFAAARLSRLAESRFNPLQAKALAGVASTFGVPRTLTGKRPGEGGFEGVMERKAKAADELARRIGPTDTQRAGMQLAEKEARLRYREQHTQMNELIKKQGETGKQMVTAAQQKQPGRAGAESAHRDAQNALEKERRTVAGREAMASEAQRIKAAEQEVERRKEVVEGLDKEARAEVANSQKMREFGEAIDEAKHNLDALGDKAKAVHVTDVSLRRALLWDKRAAPSIEGEMRAHHRREFIHDIKEAVQPAEHGDGGGTPHTAPAAPHKPEKGD